MISRFSQYLVEEEKVIYFTFGRMNPPTIGHGKLLDVLAAKAGRNPYKIFLSQSQDVKKNPLSYTDKIKSVRKMFPKHARNVMINKKVKTPFDALTALYDEGYRKVVMVAGSDRIAEYDLRLNKYNGKESGHGLYNFKDGIKMVSAGERDPDAEGAEGASGTKQRGYASDNDFIKFSQGLPPAMNTKDARIMFNAVRKGMGLKEEKSFKNHIALESVSENREAFVAGTLFGLGDSVVIKETQEVCNIVVLGSNYVIVERVDGMRFRKWLDAVEVVEAKDFKFTKNQKHKLDPNLDLPQQVYHATKQFVDVDVDGDVDKADKLKLAKDAGDVSGTPNLNKYFKKRQGMEKGHTKKGIAFESKSGVQPDWGSDEAVKKAKSMTPAQEGAKPGLWANIHARRKKGLPPKKPGEDGYPKTLNIEQTEIEKARSIIDRDKQQSIDMIAREKEKDKQKHASILARAKQAMASQKIRGVGK